MYFETVKTMCKNANRINFDNINEIVIIKEFDGNYYIAQISMRDRLKSVTLNYTKYIQNSK